MLAFNLKIAVRNIWKNKVFSAVNMFGLALSIASCLIISIYIWSELNHDTFHKHYEDIYRITEKQDQAGEIYNVAVTPGPLSPALLNTYPEIENTVRFGSWGGFLKVNSVSHEVNTMLFTDPSIFKVFDFPLVKGDINRALQSSDQILISESVAKQFFGVDWKLDTTLLEKVFTLSSGGSFRLAGVLKDVPEYSSIRFDVLLPLNYLFTTDKWSNRWGSNNYHTYVQLKKGTDAAKFEATIRDALNKFSSQTKDELHLQPFREQYLKSSFDFQTDWGKRGSIRYLKIFAGAGLLLLLIACVNFVNLSTARSLNRSREVGIRKLTGATRAQLILQFLGESLVIALISGLFAIVLINLAEPWLNDLTTNGMSVPYTEPVFVTFLFLFILFIGLLAGSYPAFVLSGLRPIKNLKGSWRFSSGKYIRQALVISQFAISVTLIICSFFMYRQLRFIQQKDLGFDKEQIVNIGLGGELAAKSSIMKEEALRIPGVINAAPATMSLVNVDNSSYLEWDGMQESEKFLITQANVDPDFITTMGMKILAGNNFSAQKTNDTSTFILNETAVKRLGYNNETVLGRMFSFWGAKGTVIGVVKDFNFKPLSTGIEPFLFRYQPQDRYLNMFLKVAPAKVATVLASLEKIAKTIDLESRFKFTFLNESINESYKSEKRTTTIIFIFAGLTVIVGCLGLFGLTLYAAEQRVKEIGIRKVLGASLQSIATLLTGEFLKLIIIAIVIAIPVAWYASSRWLQDFAYRTDLAWWVYAVVALVMILLAIITTSFQSLKAATSNPVKNLRTE